MSRGVNWLHETQRLERLARRADDSGDAIQLALKAAQERMAMLRRGEAEACPFGAIIATYIMLIFESRCEGRIPREQATPDVDGALIHDRLAAIRPHLARGAEMLADQIAHHGSVAAARMPARPAPTTPITLDTDLATVGR